jgi:hypothetical protein
MARFQIIVTRKGDSDPQSDRLGGVGSMVAATVAAVVAIGLVVGALVLGYIIAGLILAVLFLAIVLAMIRSTFRILRR